MTDQPTGRPFSESDLDSPEYRERLLRKLNYLITVLELALGKVRKSLAGPDPEVERLLRIRKNLQDTLDVCMRARTALERREQLPSDLPDHLRDSARRGGGAGSEASSEATRPARGVAVEMSSAAERERFAALGRIDAEMVSAVDLDDLARRLQA